MRNRSKKSEENKSRPAASAVIQLQDSKNGVSEGHREDVASKNSEPAPESAVLDSHQTVQKKKDVDKTGLPDQLKSGVENLSGYSMDDVKVHYNSDKPAKLQAQAYAQGTDIHVAPGKEKHLPHEAWHVAQQKQGRVNPTNQMKGKVGINDSETLENEADSMGQKAVSTGEVLQKKKGESRQDSASLKTKTLKNTTLQQRPVIQRKPTKRVTDKEITAILDRLEDEGTRKELYAVAKRLIKDGSLWFDNSIKETCAYPDPEKKIVVVTIPERLLFESKRKGDVTIERDAITYHELTHAAEIVANTGGDFSKLQGSDMDTTMVALGPICDTLFKFLEQEKEKFKAVPIKISSQPWVNLYEYCLERINYAQVLAKHSTEPSTREFPTVLIQMIHFIGAKAPKLKGGKFFWSLETLHAQALKSRETRKK
ncbi:MAG: DUF4157 domain-containing protein [Cytophagales bacterium]|nr:DUF4157 domain-containing protein [Cytophagales bacterium]